MRRIMLSLMAMSVVGAFFATPSASAQQSVNFFVGGFVPAPIDSRGDINNGVSNDVLVNNRVHALAERSSAAAGQSRRV